MSDYEYRKPPMEEPQPRLRPQVFTGCRWPVEADGGIAFCAAPRACGIYCAEHASHAAPEPATRPLLRNAKIGRPSPPTSSAGT
ncbi:MAG: hypothetical protein ACREEL_14725 [Stellaceae bacterium]